MEKTTSRFTQVTVPTIHAHFIKFSRMTLFCWQHSYKGLIRRRDFAKNAQSLTLICSCSWTSCCRDSCSCCLWNSAISSCLWSCCLCLRATSSCCSCCSWWPVGHFQDPLIRTLQRPEVHLNWQQPKTEALTDDRTTAGLGGCRASCGGRRRGVGLGNQSKGGLVVVVVHNAQVHGKDCCGCGWHLHGQCCRAHVNWKETADESRRSIWHIYNARTRDIINAHMRTNSPVF